MAIDNILRGFIVILLLVTTEAQSAEAPHGQAGECTEDQRLETHDKLIGQWRPENLSVSHCTQEFTSDGKFTTTCKNSSKDFVYVSQWEIDAQCRLKTVDMNGPRESTMVHQIFFTGNDVYAFDVIHQEISGKTWVGPSRDRWVRHIPQPWPVELANKALEAVGSNHQIGQPIPPPVPHKAPPAKPPEAPEIVITSPENYSSVTVPGKILVSVEASAGVNASTTKIDFYQGDLLVGTTQKPPYRFEWNVTTAGANTLRAQVINSAGRIAKTAVIVSARKTGPMSIKLSDGINKSTVDTDHIAVRGQVNAPDNSTVYLADDSEKCMLPGVCIRRTYSAGIIAGDGSFFFNDVKLQPGSNALRVYVTDIDGNSEWAPLNVNSKVAAPFNVFVHGEEGIAPLATSFYLSSADGRDASYAEADVSCGGSGSKDVTILPDAAVQSARSCNYTEPGVYSPVLTVYQKESDGSLQAIYSRQMKVYVYSSAQLDAKLQGIIALAFSRLAKNDVSGALNIFGEAQDTYKEAFKKLSRRELHELASSYGPPELGHINEDLAEYFIERTAKEGDFTAGSVQMMRSKDRIWRISGM